MLVGSAYRTFFKFELPDDIPENAYITDATLSVKYHSNSSSGTTNVGIYAVPYSWNENTITWNNSVGSHTTEEMWTEDRVRSFCGGINMKKITAIIIAILILISAFVSCTGDDITTTADFDNTTTTTEQDISNNANGNTSSGEVDYLDLIYETDCSGSYFTHKNIIMYTSAIVIDENAKPRVKVKINGVEEELHYVKSFYSPIGEHTIHRYFVNGEEDKIVDLGNNGRIIAISYQFATLNVRKYSTPEKIMEALKKVMEDYVDFSEYEYTIMPEQITWENTYEFYNMIDGCITESLVVEVDINGNVKRFRKYYNHEYDIPDFDIDEELVDELLELKFRDTYTTFNAEYKSYEKMFTPSVRMFNGELCVEYTTSVTYCFRSTGEEFRTYVMYILIPLELITVK